VGEGISNPEPPGSFVLKKAAPRRAAEPSWGQILVTTVKLSVLRRRHLGHRRRLAAWRWRLPAFALALALVAVILLRVTGVFTGAASAVTRAASPGGSPAGNAGAHGTASSAAGVARSQAAAWIAAQVSGSAIIACYPDMCAVLQARGVAPGRLMPLPDSAASPLGASVMVTSPSVRRQFADEYAPALIASFGSGDARIDVRAAEPGGAAAYQAALRADLAARRSAGSQLLRNWHIQFTARDAAQLRAGEVDSRLLATLAALAAQYTFRVTAFGDASPGAQVPFREVTITSGGKNGAADLAAAQAIARAQAPPYLPAYAAAGSVGGQPALSIEFAAPSPLGLLTEVS
jgi:hypothetical protein